MSTTNTTCPICQAAAPRYVLKWKEFSIYRCPSCHLRYATPLPSDQELFEFYQGFLYRPPDMDRLPSLLALRKQELNRLFAPDSTSWNGKTFLDYGGGTGLAYAAAKELGLQVYYQDLDQQAQQFVEDHFGLTADRAIPDLPSRSHNFDYIFSDNVIEHLNAPLEYLKTIREALNEGGLAVIKTPHGGNTEMFFFPLISIRDYALRARKFNGISSVWRAYWQRFWHCDPPRHLFSFTQKSLTTLAQQAGFREQDIQVSYYNLPLFKYSLLHMFLDFKTYRSAKSMLIRVFMLPFLVLESLSKVILLLLRALGVVTPAGIVLSVRKGA